MSFSRRSFGNSLGRVSLNAQVGVCVATVAAVNGLDTFSGAAPPCRRAAAPFPKLPRSSGGCRTTISGGSSHLAFRIQNLDLLPDEDFEGSASTTRDTNASPDDEIDPEYTSNIALRLSAVAIHL